MKKNILLAVFCFILSAMSFAQVPQMMSYQAVVRGSDNNLVVNQQISIRVSILQESADGEAVYIETHSATTNANGLVSIEIGNGTSNDNFSTINWANGPYFVKTETDVNGGENYEIVGVSQLLSVPYAMYAQSAGNMPDVSGFLSEETDPQFNAWDKDYNDLTNRPEIPTVPTNVSAFENDANYISTENQTIADAAALGNSVNAQLKDLVDPTENQDAATKKYIDELIAQMQAEASALQTEVANMQARLNATSFTITFDANGGSGEMAPQIFVQGIVQPLSNHAYSRRNYTFVNWNTSPDGSGVTYPDATLMMAFANITLYAQWEETQGYVDGHAYIDLGLPSGTLWATCNVGATSPEDCGDYFAWGETEPKSYYDWNTYQWCNGSGNSITKYCNGEGYGYNGYFDNISNLEPSDDAATANWGTGWRMPTNDELNELLTNCTVTWNQQNGVNGWSFTGTNGNSIFMPAVGNRSQNNLNNASSGYYWSSSLYTNSPNSARCIQFILPSTNRMAYEARCIGQCVRPVCATME